MKTICLVMIVRNEAAVIRRCLDSVSGIIHYWVICDTGSSDDTTRMIREALKEIPGELHETPWVDFGHNRTLALKHARGKADYHLLIDADMTVSIRGEFGADLTADAYLVRHEGDWDYSVERLVSDRHEWRYVGATHEFICAGSATTREKIPQLSVTHYCDGSSRAVKFQRDIDLLRNELEQNPDNVRSIFYLAQSYRDIGNFAQAIEWYEKRVSRGGWDEEVWYSLYQVASLQHRLGLAWPLVLDAYLRAYEYRPTRLEPIYHVARFYRENGQYHLGYLFSRAVINTPYPDDILFIEKGIYEHDLPQEYALCCERLGKRAESLHSSVRPSASVSSTCVVA
jgi:glycosyltransferase involved in cell wall biosynthesis